MHSEKLRVVVTDGITICHPCCGVAHCSQFLENNKDRFGQGHKDEQNINVVLSNAGNLLSLVIYHVLSLITVLLTPEGRWGTWHFFS